MTTNVRRLAYFDFWIHPVAEDVLAEAAGIEIVKFAQTSTDDDVFAGFQNVHGYQMLSKTELQPRFWPDRKFIECCPSLLAISSVGAGYDVCDVDACTEAGILVVNNTGANADSVAQHVIGMLLALSKNMIRLDRMLRRQAGVDRMQYPGRETTGKTLGIVGLGNIGRRVAKIAKQSLGLRVIAYDPYITDADFKERDAEKVDYDTIWRTADYVSINTPLTAETKGMVGAREFKLMKPGSIFITNARGGIHDERALADALASGHLDGAGIDVFDVEPPGPGHPLMAFDNVILTPHVAGITDVCMYQMAKGGAEQWVEIMNGRRPPRLVNPEAWPKYRERHARVLGHPPAD
ncbi:MAG: hydroxyacid dehydrogenase [Proteobacteria bacterium]|nr:hydroxyacid dehydrogenase [Pseudomonadota bacterium]